MPSHDTATASRLYHYSVPPTALRSETCTPPPLPAPTPAYICGEMFDIEQWLYHRELEGRGLDPRLPLEDNYRGKHSTAIKNIEHFIRHVGAESVAIMTLTFRRTVTAEIASAAFAKFLRRFRKAWLGHWIKIIEMTSRGQLHIHLVAQIRENIAAGTDFTAIQRYRDECNQAAVSGRPLSWSARCRIRNQTSRNAALRSIWQEFETSRRDCGLAWEFDCFPVLNPIGAARYLAKDLVQRLPFFHQSGRKVQAIRYSKGCPRKVRPRQGRSPWFTRAVTALLGACGQSHESYFCERLENPRWTYVVGKEIGPHLETVDASWVTMAPVALAQLLIRECHQQQALRYYCSRILTDLTRVATTPQPPLPAPSRATYEANPQPRLPPPSRPTYEAFAQCLWN